MPTAAGQAMASSASIPDSRNKRANQAAPEFASATNRRDTQSFLIDKIDK
jgi:hypothetical protein